MSRLFDNKLFQIILFLTIVAVYFALIIPSLDKIGIAFDEQTDWNIAKSYSSDPGGWLNGTNHDPTNVRLPMFVSWLLFDLVPNDLYSARLTATLMGALTLVGVFAYCWLAFTPLTGLLACLILAMSPYFLAFSKVAFTEGDSFLTCGTIWVLVALQRLRQTGTVGWAGISGVLLGLSLSAKASAFALAAASALILLLPFRTPNKLTTPLLPVLAAKQSLILLLLTALVPVLIALGYLFSWPQTLSTLPETYAQLSYRFKAFHYLIVCLPWLACLFLLLRLKDQRPGYIFTPLLVLSLAGVTFFILPPVHTTNPAILYALFDIFHSSTNSFSWQFAAEAATLHTLVLLFKPGLLMGIGLWCAVALALWQAGVRTELRPLLIVFLIYFAFLVFKMPHAQTFYMMPLFPLAAIMLADLMTRLTSRSLKVGLPVVTLLLFSAVYDLVRTYPYSHVNGYQWLGEQHIGGRSTLGYRSVAQTPSDGLEQSLEWLKANLNRGQRVLYFTHADHILQPRLENCGLVYLNGFHPIYSLDQVNYVLTHINADINNGRGTDNPSGSIYRYNYSKDELERNFRKIYSLKRPFGIEVAAIWFKNIPYNIDESGNIIGLLSAEDGRKMHSTVD